MARLVKTFLFCNLKRVYSDNSAATIITSCNNPIARCGLSEKMFEVFVLANSNIDRKWAVLSVSGVTLRATNFFSVRAGNQKKAESVRDSIKAILTIFIFLAEIFFP